MQTYLNTFNFDILVQGFIFITFLSAALLIFFTNYFEGWNHLDSIKELLIKIEKEVKGVYRFVINKELKDAHFPFIIAFILVNVILAYGVGNAVNSVADKWMDGENIKHIGLKYFWLEEDQLYKTGSALRISAFDDIFKEADKINKSAKKEIYYSTKHFLLKDETYSKYLQTTQEKIYYSQVFCFSAFVLFVFTYLNFISISLRNIYIFSKKYTIVLGVSIVIIILLSFIDYKIGFPNSDIKSFVKFALVILYLSIPVILFLNNIIRNKIQLFNQYFITNFILFFSFLIYIFFANSWKIEEETLNKKAYGIFKSITPELRNRDFQQLLNCYSIDTVNSTLFIDFSSTSISFIENN